MNIVLPCSYKVMPSLNLKGSTLYAIEGQHISY